jgi:hypothetical protein
VKIIAPRPDRFTGPEHHRLHARLADLVSDLTSSGATADRPTVGLYAGKTYFDTTLGQPIWYDQAAGVWVDATGTPA